MNFLGTHGTNKENIDSIKRNNFQPSKGHHHWCGKGVYFFIDGINSQPIEVLAEHWGKDNAYDKRIKGYKYKEYSVLRVPFEVMDEHIFDLRIEAAAKFCNEVRLLLENETLRLGKKMNDFQIWEYIHHKLGIQLFIKNDYIKFGISRKLRIESRIDNCTIVSLVNPKLYIDVNKIEIIKEGSI
ncbi:MAG: hypothetical protein LBS20_13570 [Prevotella sp.]|jgi:hypothetical protein|nr:hypothetical protein [Prevotella sp.]